MKRTYRERGERQYNERGELCCIDCKEWFPLAAFGLQAKTLADGAQVTYARSYCPECNRARGRIRKARYQYFKRTGKRLLENRA
jgi:hypothetical protein